MSTPGSVRAAGMALLNQLDKSNQPQNGSQPGPPAQRPMQQQIGFSPLQSQSQSQSQFGPRPPQQQSQPHSFSVSGGGSGSALTAQLQASGSSGGSASFSYAPNSGGGARSFGGPQQSTPYGGGSYSAAPYANSAQQSNANPASPSASNSSGFYNGGGSVPAAPPKPGSVSNRFPFGGPAPPLPNPNSPASAPNPNNSASVNMAAALANAKSLASNALGQTQQSSYMTGAPNSAQNPSANNPNSYSTSYQRNGPPASSGQYNNGGGSSNPPPPSSGVASNPSGGYSYSNQGQSNQSAQYGANPANTSSSSNPGYGFANKAFPPAPSQPQSSNQTSSQGSLSGPGAFGRSANSLTAPGPISGGSSAQNAPPPVVKPAGFFGTMGNPGANYLKNPPPLPQPQSDAAPQPGSYSQNQSTGYNYNQPPLPSQSYSAPYSKSQRSGSVISVASSISNASSAVDDEGPLSDYTPRVSIFERPEFKPPGSTNCSVNGCFAVAEINQLCIKHYYSQTHNEPANNTIRRPPPPAAGSQAPPRPQSNNFVSPSDGGAPPGGGGKMTPAEERLKFAQELISTEKTYIQNLDILIKIFINRLREMLNLNRPLLSKDEISGVFLNIEDIYNLNKKFFDDLENLERGNLLLTPELGQTMKSYAAFFRLYIQYVNHYDEANRLVASLRERNKDFDFFLKVNENCEKQRIQDFLITPVQRIPRYLLLLRGMLKCTDQADPLHKSLEVALVDLEKVANEINSSLHDREARLRVVEVQSHLEGCDIPLAIPTRYHVRDGPLSKERREVFGSAFRKCHFWLFNDLLMYTTEVNMFGNFRLKKILELATLEVLDIPNEKNNFGFELRTPAKYFAVRASTAAEKEIWMKAIISQAAVAKKQQLAFASRSAALSSNSDQHSDGEEEVACFSPDLTLQIVRPGCLPQHIPAKEVTVGDCVLAWNSSSSALERIPVKHVYTSSGTSAGQLKQFYDLDGRLFTAQHRLPVINLYNISYSISSTVWGQRIGLLYVTSRGIPAMISIGLSSSAFALSSKAYEQSFIKLDQSVLGSVETELVDAADDDDDDDDDKGDVKSSSSSAPTPDEHKREVKSGDVGGGGPPEDDPADSDADIVDISITPLLCSVCGKGRCRTISMREVLKCSYPGCSHCCHPRCSEALWGHGARTTEVADYFCDTHFNDRSISFTLRQRVENSMFRWGIRFSQLATFLDWLPVNLSIALKRPTVPYDRASQATRDFHANNLLLEWPRIYRHYERNAQRERKDFEDIRMEIKKAIYYGHFILRTRRKATIERIFRDHFKVSSIKHVLDGGNWPSSADIIEMAQCLGQFYLEETERSGLPEDEFLARLQFIESHIRFRERLLRKEYPSVDDAKSILLNMLEQRDRFGIVSWWKPNETMDISVEQLFEMRKAWIDDHDINRHYAVSLLRLFRPVIGQNRIIPLKPVTYALSGDVPMKIRDVSDEIMPEAHTYAELAARCVERDSDSEASNYHFWRLNIRSDDSIDEKMPFIPIRPTDPGVRAVHLHTMHQPINAHQPMLDQYNNLSLTGQVMLDIMRQLQPHTRRSLVISNINPVVGGWGSVHSTDPQWFDTTSYMFLALTSLKPDYWYTYGAECNRVVTRCLPYQSRTVDFGIYHGVTELALPDGQFKTIHRIESPHPSVEHAVNRVQRAIVFGECIEFQVPMPAALVDPDLLPSDAFECVDQSASSSAASDFSPTSRHCVLVSRLKKIRQPMNYTGIVLDAPTEQSRFLLSDGVLTCDCRTE